MKKGGAGPGAVAISRCGRPPGWRGPQKGRAAAAPRDAGPAHGRGHSLAAGSSGPGPPRGPSRPGATGLAAAPGITAWARCRHEAGRHLRPGLVCPPFRLRPPPPRPCRGPHALRARSPPYSHVREAAGTQAESGDTPGVPSAADLFTPESFLSGNLRRERLSDQRAHFWIEIGKIRQVKIAPRIPMRIMQELSDSEPIPAFSAELLAACHL